MIDATSSGREGGGAGSGHPQKSSTPSVNSSNNPGNGGCGENADLSSQAMSGNNNNNSNNHHHHHIQQHLQQQQHSGGSLSGSDNGSGGGLSSNAGIVIEQDTYAILPSSIQFAAVVKSVLAKLGYAAQETIGAKGKH